METVSIYLLHDDHNCAYVGKAANPTKRFKEHLWKSKKKTKKVNWINNRKANGETIHFTILDSVPEKDWRFWERHYISLITSWGFNMKNSDEGGVGCSRQSDATKNKISMALTGKPHGKLDKSIYMYSIQGDFIKEYRPIISVEKDGFCRVGVVRASKNPANRTSLGYRWSITKVEKINPISDHNKLKVVRTDLNGNNPVVYDSLKIKGFSDSKICNCCKGVRKSHRGFKWAYLSDYKNE